MERSDLLDLLFQIFEERPNNSLKALVDRTKQPLAWLREVLNDICIQNKRGPHSGSYELKPEYKQKSQEEAQE
jgi:transcription initiation factor TFIIF subunit beta